MPEPKMVSNGRLLLVDDEAAILNEYARILSDTGFIVTRAPGGEEAVRHLERERFDVVLCDFEMPEMTGLALLQRVRARDRDVPVIFMLDEPNNQYSVRAVAQGARQCLVKPIEAEALVEVTTNALELFRSRHPVQPPTQPPSASFSATDAKNEFGRVLEMVIQGNKVVITKHDSPKAIMLSMAEYNALVAAQTSQLDTLTAEFDALLASMQTPKAREAVKTAFAASPAQLGRAAVAAARKRG